MKYFSGKEPRFERIQRIPESILLTQFAKRDLASGNFPSTKRSCHRSNNRYRKRMDLAEEIQYPRRENDATPRARISIIHDDPCSRVYPSRALYTSYHGAMQNGEPSEDSACTFVSFCSLS